MKRQHRPHSYLSERDGSPEAVRARFARLVWAQAAAADRQRAYPVTTQENFEEAYRFQVEREAELLRAVGCRA